MSLPTRKVLIIHLLVYCTLYLFQVAPGPTLPSTSSLVCLSHKIIVSHSSVHSVALPKFPTARETADHLVHHVVRFPWDIVSDRGPQFISQVWRAFCQALGPTISLSSGLHLQINGQMERAYQDLEALQCVAAINPSS